MLERILILLITTVIILATHGPAEEIIGNDETEVVQSESMDTGEVKDKGFKQGSIFVNAGFMYGSSLIGGEFEFGLARFLGLEIGGGFVGANAGMNLHVLPKKHLDLCLSALADYMPALEAVLPDFNLIVRGFFGSSARVGICGRIGVAICTVNKSVGAYQITVEYKRGAPMLTYALGVAIKAKK